MTSDKFLTGLQPWSYMMLLVYSPEATWCYEFFFQNMRKGYRGLRRLFSKVSLNVWCLLAVISFYKSEEMSLQWIWYSMVILAMSHHLDSEGWSFHPCRFLSFGLPWWLLGEPGPKGRKSWLNPSWIEGGFSQNLMINSKGKLLVLRSDG